MDKKNIRKKIYGGELLAVYGDFLTTKQYEYMELYYQEDYSLAEIAENYHVSRVAIHNQIMAATQKITEFEEKLHVSFLLQHALPKL